MSSISFPVPFPLQKKPRRDFQRITVLKSPAGACQNYFSQVVYRISAIISIGSPIASMEWHSPSPQ